MSQILLDMLRIPGRLLFMNITKAISRLAAKIKHGVMCVAAPKAPYWAHLPMTDDLERELNNRYWKR